MIKINQAGDTIVEVLLATVVLSVVLTGAYSLTNRATRINQTAIERTQATHLMQEQIELIRLSRTRGADDPLWSNVKTRATASPPSYVDCSPSPGGNSFFIANASSTVTSNYNGADPLNDAHPDDFYRVWVEAVRAGDPSYRYIDFHARVCWEGIGGEVEQRSGIVLRLAE